MVTTLNTNSARAVTRTLAAEHLDTDLSGLFCTLKTRAKLQTLVYDILPSNLKEDAGNRCSECDSKSKPGFASAKPPFYTAKPCFYTAKLRFYMGKPSFVTVKPPFYTAMPPLSTAKASFPADSFRPGCVIIINTMGIRYLTVFVLAMPYIFTL